MTDRPVGRNYAPLEPLVAVIGVGASRTIGPITVTLYSIERYATGFRAVTGFTVRREHPVAAAVAQEIADLHDRLERAQAAGAADADPSGVVDEGGGWVGYTPSRSERLVWHAEDELGTAYEATMGGGHGGGLPDTAWRIEVEVRPAIPDTALRLTLAATELRWYEHDFGGHRSTLVHTEVGPWTFEVDLLRPA